MSRRALRKALTAAVVSAGLVFALRVDVGTAQDDLVRIEGRVLGIAGQTMVVAPYASGAGPINVDLSQASQDEYMALRTADPVTVTGRILQERHGVMATSIQGRRIMIGRWTTTVASLALAASVGLTGCAAIRRSQATDREQFLAAAGFRMELADTASGGSSSRMRPYRLTSRATGDGIEYTYADPRTASASTSAAPGSTRSISG